MDTRWQIELLGRLRVVGDERVVTRFQTQKTGALLAYLAYFIDLSHPREVLVDLLWPESEPSAGRNSLSKALTSLRHQLEPPSVPPGAVILAHRATVQLNPAACITDAAEFEGALQAASRAGSQTQREQQLTKAVCLYRGELLPGLFAPWILHERPRLAEAFLQALGQLMAYQEQAGDLHGALQWARRAVAADPLREEGHREVMRLLAAAGQPDAALHQYGELGRLLAAELGAEPEAETHSLAQELAALIDRRGGRPRQRGDGWTSASGGEAARTPSFDRIRQRSDGDGKGATPGDTEPLPPPAVPTGRVGRLPMQFTRFFGREREIARLLEILHEERSAPRLVTLTGPGGSGKTRLALEVATRLQESLRRAAWFVPLAELADPLQIVDKTLEGLRLPRCPSVEPIEQVVAVLSRQPSLLVLDNFEHLVADGAEIVRALLERAPALTCLITSRRRLDLAGEREFPIPPLPTPQRNESPVGAEWVFSLARCPSVQLFVDRVQAVRPDFQVTKANAAAVAAVCERLEGIPLAIELAAARAQALTPAQLLARLSQRFDLLATRQRDVASRHRSLRAALDWSYQLLSAEQQRFFTRLSVFRGGWTSSAAEAVCETGPRTLEYLEQLRECSLVLAVEGEEEMQFHMLETLREYGAEQLTPAEQTALARRHSAYYLALAEEAEPSLHRAERARWLQRLAVEHDNLRAALGWCRAEPDGGEPQLRLAGALWSYWGFRGHWREGREWLAEALARPETRGRTHARARALFAAGALAYEQGDHASARALQMESVAISRETGDKRCLAYSLCNLGWVARSQGDSATACSVQEESAAIFRKLGDRQGLVGALNCLSTLAFEQGEPVVARSLAEETVATAREAGDPLFLSWALSGLGQMAHALRDLTAARSLNEECLVMQRELGHEWSMAVSLERLGEVATCQSDYGNARAFLEESLAIWRKLENRGGVASSLYHLGRVERDRGNYQPARAFLEESLAVYRDLGDEQGVVACLEGLAGLDGETPEHASG